MFLEGFNYNFLYTIPIVLVFVAIYVSFYLINKKVKRPEDCPKQDIGCSSCMLTCNTRKENFSPKDYFLADGSRKIYVELEEVKPLNKKDLAKEQEKFIQEMRDSGSIK